MGDRIIQKKADFFKALSHPTRIKILELLREGELCVCDILEALKLEQSNVSQHLAILRKQGILNSRKKGLKVLYSIKNIQTYDVIDFATNILRQDLLEDSILVEQFDDKCSSLEDL